MLDKLIAANFQVDFRSHAMAILKIDFPEVAEVIEDVLLGSTIPIEEIIRSGGGETKGTQRLRNALRAREWNKHNFIVERTIDGVPREAQSHEVDHVRTLAAGTIALEIEWNNKDPFFDRDLENFKRLHAEDAICLGIILTRGSSLHSGMKDFIARFGNGNQINSIEDLVRLGIDPTPKHKILIERQVKRGKDFRSAWVNTFVSSKFG